MSGNRSLIASGALVAVCLAVWGVCLLLPGGAGASDDVRGFVLPRFVYGSRELWRGHFPLWNPYEYGGIPFFATALPAVLYPPKALLFALFDESVAYWSFVLLHYAALAAGFVLFLREQRVTGFPAFFGTALWTLALPVFFARDPTKIANFAFVPPCLLLVERIGRGVRARRAAAWLVVVLALVFTAGYPEFVVELGVVVAAHAIVRFSTGDWSVRPLRTIPLFVGLFLVAALVVAVELVPMIEAAWVARQVIGKGRCVAAQGFAAFYAGWFAAVYAERMLGSERATNRSSVAGGVLIWAAFSAFEWRAFGSVGPRPAGEMADFRATGVSLSGRALSLPDVDNGRTLVDRIPTALGAEERFVPLRYRRINEHLSYAPRQGKIDWAALVTARGFSRAMNLEYVVTPREVIGSFVSDGFRAIRLDRQRRALLRNAPGIGEAWVNFDVRRVDSEALAEEYVLGTDFDSASEAVVEETLAEQYERPPFLPPSVPMTLHHVSATDEEVEVEIPIPGVLVVSESYYPGWTALLDGHPARVFAADYVLRAIEVPAGSHRIVFEYRPASVRWGAVLSVLGLVALSALFTHRRSAEAA